jgi:hypothetical protein
MEVESILLESIVEWKCINKECLICNNKIGFNCIKCDTNFNSFGCMSIMNNNPICKHSFHAHCIQQYHKNNNKKCPMCNYDWYN